MGWVQVEGALQVPGDARPDHEGIPRGNRYMRISVCGGAGRTSSPLCQYYKDLVAIDKYRL